MNLDERLRTDLGRSFEPRRLDEDHALAQVWSVHRRDQRRARVLRQLTVGVVLVAMFAAVGAFVLWRGNPDRHPATVERRPSETQADISKKVTALHNELRRVDRELTRIDPARYGALLNDPAYRSGMPFGNPPKTPTPTIPSVPKDAPVAELNLALERPQLIDQIAALAAESAQRRRSGQSAGVGTKPARPTPAAHVGGTSTSTGWAVAIAVGALLILLAGAFVIYRIRMRATPDPVP